MLQNQVIILNFDILCVQKIEVIEVKLGIELYQFRSGFEDVSDIVVLVFVVEKREFQDDIICFDLLCI